VLAWVFVVFRVLRAFLHVTSNIPRLRGALLGLGSVMLALMWAIFIVRELTGT
jgi:hypothetical protein